MRKKAVYLLTFIAIAIFQLSFLPVIADKKVAIDAVLMLILAWSVLDGFFLFLGWAIFFGIFYDLISYSIVGSHALIFLLIVYFVSFFSRRFSMEFKGMGSILFLLFIFVAMLTSNTITALTIAWKMETLNNYWKNFGSLDSIVTQLIYNTIFFFLCFNFMKKIKKYYAIEN